MPMWCHCLHSRDSLRREPRKKLINKPLSLCNKNKSILTRCKSVENSFSAVSISKPSSSSSSSPELPESFGSWVTFFSGRVLLKMGDQIRIIAFQSLFINLTSIGAKRGTVADRPSRHPCSRTCGGAFYQTVNHLQTPAHSATS